MNLIVLHFRIGFSVAKRLAEEGASVVVSSRKAQNVDAAVEKLSKSGLSVFGVPCHVSKQDQRENLIEKVSISECPFW